MSKQRILKRPGKVKLGRNYARRSGGGFHKDRRREWNTLKRSHYSGYYRCTDCGEITFCVGNTRESVQCEACFGLEEDGKEEDRGGDSSGG